MIRVYFFILFHFVQVALCDFSMFNNVNKVYDVTQVNDVSKVNYVTEVDDATEVNDIINGINEVSYVIDTLPNYHKSSKKEILTLGCRLRCRNTSERIFDNLWSCEWRPTKSHCHNITREIMRNADTIYPTIPYLMNVSTTPRFSIVLFPRITEDRRLEISEFQDGFLLDYPNLFGFFFYNSPFEKIKGKMFEGVERLRYLYIYNCPSLSVIEDGAFDNMTSLLSLVLLDDALTKIEAATFRNLISLINLDLTNNSIIYVHKDAFINLSNLRKILLKENKITIFHSDTFKNQAKLEILGLDNNEIGSLPRKIFKNLINLQAIYLFRNPLSAIHNGMFNYSGNLDWIYLGCCPALTAKHCKKANLTIEKGGLSTKSILKAIGISGCLDDLKPSAFEGVATEFLSIANDKRLTKIKRNIFEGIRKISSLTIANSGIETIEYDSFQSVAFTELMRLNLTMNKLKKIPNGILSQLAQLRVLDLSYNSIITITPHIFADLKSLMQLHLESNHIIQIQGDAFSSLGSLKFLTLQHNQISNLSSISFQGLQALVTLDLSANRLKTISYKDFDWGSPYQSSLLATLRLQQNQIRIIEGFHLSLALDELNLSDNNISDLHGSFKSINRNTISKLILSRNRISELGIEDLRYIDGMKELFLDRNRLKTVSFIMFLRYTILERLDISQNNITEVSGEMMKTLQMINHLNISKNPWKCGCEKTDRDLMQFLLNHNIISCCPNLCQCYMNADGSVFMNCTFQNKSSMPPCLPYEKVNLDYANNIITNLDFTKDQENISFLDMHHNSITSISGPSLKMLKKLTVLNLKSNFLHTLPQEMNQLSSTKIYLQGNEFFCDDCSLVKILRSATQRIPQNITCMKNQNYAKESLICLVKLTIVPYSFLSFSIVVLIIMVYTMGKLLYIKRLKKRYERKTIILSSKELIKAYKQECALLLEIDHQNILKMYANLTTWIPFVKHVGNLFLEKADYALSEVLGQTVILAFPLNVRSLTVDLLSAVHYLHSREYPICHRQLGTNNVYLLQDIVSETVILKIGDLSLAKRFVPLNSADESTPLAHSSDDQTNNIQADLQAVAKIIFALLTKKERDKIIQKEEIMKLSEIEFGILILALQEGMTAAQALKAAPYHSAEQRKSILGELNAYLKRIKNGKKSAEILQAAEENACLVIGGKGAWNKHFEFTVMEEFALLFNGYNITSFVDLLRLIRNMLEHGHECPKSMEAAFQTKMPTPEMMFKEFSRNFPFFYLHSLSCYYNLFKERSHTVSDIFMTTYMSFEKSLSRDLLIQGSLLPLQEKSCVFLHLKSSSDNVRVTLVQTHTKSCIRMNDIFPEILKKITELWHDVSVTEVIFKYHGKFIQNPYTNACSPTPDYAVTSKIFVPEGATIEVIKPELLVHLPDKIISMGFKRTDNIKAIKGLALKQLNPSLRKKVKPKNISVTVNGNHLKDIDRLVDLDLTVALTVKYTHVEI